MKTAEEILTEHYGCSTWKETCRDFLDEVSPSMIVEAIKIAQTESRNEAIEEIADFVEEMVEWGESPESIKNAILDFKK